MDFPQLKQKAFEYNLRSQAREKKLTDIRDLLPAPGKILKIKEFVELIRKLHEILGVGK